MTPESASHDSCRPQIQTVRDTFREYRNGLFKRAGMGNFNKLIDLHQDLCTIGLLALSQPDAHER